MSQERLLRDGLTALNLALSQETQKKLLEYLALLGKWNKVHNLTAVRDPEEMVSLHLLDSLAVLPHLECSTLLDVGSGAGLPGIPLAMVRPDLKVTVLDSSHKKTTFQRQAKVELGITNLEVVCSRVEQFRPAERFDCVISRAFSDIGEFLKLTSHLVKDEGHWLAMKGVYPYEELAQAGVHGAEVVTLHVPNVNAHRHLVRIEAKK